MNVDVLSALARALSFIALFQAAGVMIVLALFAARLEHSVGQIRRLGFFSAIAGLALVSVHYFVEAGRMAGSLSGALDMSLQQIVGRRSRTQARARAPFSAASPLSMSSFAACWPRLRS